MTVQRRKTWIPAPWMIIRLFLFMAGSSCTALLGPENAPIHVEHQTNLLTYPMDGEIVITLTNVGPKRVVFEHHRLLRQWHEDGWSDGLRIWPVNTAIIMEPEYRSLRPGESVTDTFPISALGAELGGRYRIVRRIISEQNREGILSESNPFSVER